MKKLIGLMVCAVCAIVVSLSLWGIEWRGENGDAFREAVKAMRGEGRNRENFNALYWDLHAREPQMGAWFCFMHPDMVERGGEIWNQVYKTGSGSRGVSHTPAPPRGGAAIDRLCFTEYKYGPTSHIFRVGWPTQGPNKVEFPIGLMDLLFSLDLANGKEGWFILDEIPVTEAQGWVTFEYPYAWFSWYDYAGGTRPPQGFFNIRPTDPDEWWWWWGGGVEEGDGEALYIPPPLPPLGPVPGQVVALERNGVSTTAQKSETVQVDPGRHYLITVRCTDNEVPAIQWQWGEPYRNSTFSWTITVPGMAPLTGSADTQAHLQMIATYDNRYFLDDFWFVSIPTNTASPAIQVVLSINSDPPPEDYGVLRTVLMDVQVLPVSLIQYNMPTNALPPTRGSTDFGARDMNGISLQEGGIAFITGEPTPPALGVAMHRSSISGDAPEGLTLAWRLDIQTERPDYRNNATMKLDDRTYPTNGIPQASTLNPHSCYITGELMNHEIVGGKCALTIQATDVNGNVKSNKFNFFIRGMNPPDATVNTYLNNLVNASPSLSTRPSITTTYPAIMCAIVWHESPDGSYRLCQFNAQTNRLQWLIFKGNNSPPNEKGVVSTNWGYGICQIDMGAFTNGATRWVSTAGVYNWHTNCIMGVRKMESSLVTYNGFIADFQRTYPGCGNPPASYKVGNITFTAEQFGVIVLYNGAQGVPWSEVWTGEKDKNGKKIMKSIRSPVIFNPDSQKWTFHDNHKNYVLLIAGVLSANPPPTARE